MVSGGMGHPRAGWDKVENRRIRYNGQGFSLRGEKDRFVLPPEFRKALRDSGDGDRVLCLQVHETLPALVAFGLSRESELDNQLDREEEIALQRGTAFNRQLRASQLFGFTRLPFDDSGRFVMPPRFLKAARIDDALFFQGAGSEFLIFNPAELAGLGDEWNHAKIGCEDCEAQARAAKGRK